ncbi:hypothetical protein [Streptomyces sp. NPDC052092]|uniref:hypothetical protein n=1 Tax=Streptomyces sp. NPDC052092 TaxID=3365685 RepID=UPI0037D2EFBF
MNWRDQDGEVIEAEFVDGALALVEEPLAQPRVDANTVLRPGQAVPTTADPDTQDTQRDLYVSEETARILDESDPGDSGPMKAFKVWCAEHGRVAVPCTTATFTEYGRRLMQRGLKVATIKNYMSRIRTAMPAGKKPDNSLYLRLLADYRKRNKRAVRTRQAFPITLPYLVPMMEKAEADGRPVGIRDAAMLAFGYRFLGRSIEDANLEIEDLTITDDRIVVWLRAPAGMVPAAASRPSRDPTAPRTRGDGPTLRAELRRMADCSLHPRGMAPPPALSPSPPVSAPRTRGDEGRRLGQVSLLRLPSIQARGLTRSRADRTRVWEDS